MPRKNFPYGKLIYGLARPCIALSARWHRRHVALELSTEKQYHRQMKRKHQRTLELIFARPTSANIPWREIEALFAELGAQVSEREGSRVAVVLFGEVRVFHRPHPSPDTDKGAVASIRKWLEQQGVVP
jgi:hypothetical protein